MGLLDKIQNRIELYRLEKKYARRSNRTTFSTGATYVDGEYIYNANSNTSGILSASSTGSSRNTGMSKRMSSFMGRQ